MTDKPLTSHNVVPLREDGPRIAAFLNGIDGGDRPTSAASIAGVHLDPALGLAPAVPGALLDVRAAHAQNLRDGSAAVGTAEAEAVTGLVPAADSSEEEDDDSIDAGVIHYPRKLHEAGEAAIAIVANMCEAEFAMGNPRNLPEPILGWYVMTLSYQLCVLEATAQPADARAAHARQLDAARKAFAKYTGPYAEGVREEVDETLRMRYHWDAIRDDGTYGGILPAPRAKDA